jgi:DNA-binding NarL/FixJ family response regulator
MKRHHLKAALEAGCQEYLLKLLAPGALERALRSALPGYDFTAGAAGPKV